MSLADSEADGEERGTQASTGTIRQLPKVDLVLHPTAEKSFIIININIVMLKLLV